MVKGTDHQRVYRKWCTKMVYSFADRLIVHEIRAVHVVLKDSATKWDQRQQHQQRMNERKRQNNNNNQRNESKLF